MTDFDRLKSALNEDQILAIMNRFGVSEFHDSGSYLSFPTICHNKHVRDAGFNLVYYKDSKLFRCFSECGETFDIFGLVRKRLEIEHENTHPSNLYYFVLNHTDANIQVENEPAYQEIDADIYRKQPIEFELPAYNPVVLESFSTYYPVEWLNDGITKEAMDKYGIKYSISRNSIIIPHHDVNGRLVGIRNRPLDPEVAEKYGKYLPVKVEQTVYKHPIGLNLYGLYQAKEAISETGIAIIAEGEKCCLQAESLLEKNVVTAASGNNLNKWHILLLLKYTDVKEIIIAFDREEKSGEKKYYKRLYDMCLQYRGYANISFIYDTTLMKMKESPFDNTNKETLQTLIDRRIKIR